VAVDMLIDDYRKHGDASVFMRRVVFRQQSGDTGGGG
jgi:hypothetical protein